ncbi:hypothetical protein CHU98_g4235 [Xylaria longipes]|nr:hypothetical protein CHU98_g4235 [Xylaria longipes]
MRKCGERAFRSLNQRLWSEISHNHTRYAQYCVHDNQNEHCRDVEPLSTCVLGDGSPPLSELARHDIVIHAAAYYATLCSGVGPEIHGLVTLTIDRTGRSISSESETLLGDLTILL